jgi:hypothetical protein
VVGGCCSGAVVRAVLIFRSARRTKAKARGGRTRRRRKLRKKQRKKERKENKGKGDSEPTGTGVRRANSARKERKVPIPSVVATPAERMDS